LENITDLTPGDVLIAGYDEAHRTEVNLSNVAIRGITKDEVHLKFADLFVSGSNIPFEQAAEGNETKVQPMIMRAAGGIGMKVRLMDEKTAQQAYSSCEGKFVPMR